MILSEVVEKLRKATLKLTSTIPELINLIKVRNINAPAEIA